ncbi:MAG: YfcE family phosphodiesterase [Clostridia bacterium]|nr:YfcE family phosphodiesterase [Clostridia bacterium]
MKICVFSDIHGSVAGMEYALNIVLRERPDKVVICGDLFGARNTGELVALVKRIDAVTYLIRGNNDRDNEVALLPCGMDGYAVMYHFGRTLFFTHGHVYNKYLVPPVLKENDVLVYGHTHCALLQKFNGLFIANVGSVSFPRDGTPSYLVIEECGITLKGLDGETINELHW